jgi:hypothetical protein
MDELTPDQIRAVYACMREVVEGKAPLTFFDLNWSKINTRANADRATFSVPGFEAFDAGGVRGKGRR